MWRVCVRGFQAEPHPFKKGSCANCFHVHPGATSTGEEHGKVRAVACAAGTAARCVHGGHRRTLAHLPLICCLRLLLRRAGALSRRHEGGLAGKGWVAAQQKAFTKWMNVYLRMRKLHVTNIFEDLRDGTKLIHLLEVISGKPINKPWQAAPTMRIKMVRARRRSRTSVWLWLWLCVWVRLRLHTNRCVRARVCVRVCTTLKPSR